MQYSCRRGGRGRGRKRRGEEEEEVGRERILLGDVGGLVGQGSA